ncbi:hypothetical protein FACS1894170_01900 [Planctomycetales bacterium]|nr:hypothetical protein FACS1894170_01900 [Planctomycetales bacterium]
MTNFFGGIGVDLSARFLFWLLGGQPDWSDEAAVRLWCVRNHRWLVILAKRTSNQYDDRFAELLLAVFESPELFGLLWRQFH